MKKKNKHFLRNIILLLVFLGLIFLGVKTYLNYLKSPVDPNGKVIAFVIKSGESTTSIADRLQKEGLIKSSFIFKMELKNSGKSGNIEAGDFKLSPAMSSKEIIENLSKGSVDKWVTLLEGWRIEEMAEKLNKDLDVDKAGFLKAAKEGYMFPDTYLINPKSTAADLVSILRNNFDNKYNSELQSKIKSKGLTPDQGVILASIVEREARSAEVRTKVASILLKRFKMNMGLNADATVQYAKDSQKYKQNGGKLDKFWLPVTQEDYKLDSPYNTYLHSGLPPAPIANPSLMSLQAVANSDPSTPYVYYYHDLQGETYYAKTLNEHNENVANHR